MAYFVTEGATLKCSFGDKASTLKVPQPHGSFIEGKAQATVVDFIPMFNVQPFGKCSCLANPTVAAATAAKNGTLTPMPCIPMLNRMWSFGKANLKIMGSRALLDTSANQCIYGGVIKIEDPNVNSVSEGAKLKKVQFVTLEKIGIIKESKGAPESEGVEGAGKTKTPAEQYADLVNSNKKWTWDNDMGKFSHNQRAAIKKEALERGLIPDVPMKPGTKYPDFEKAGMIQKVDELPKSLWQASDKTQFKYLDSRISGGRPDDTTWHHSEIPGRMELVPFGQHNIINHTGGRSIGGWCYRPEGR